MLKHIILMLVLLSPLTEAAETSTTSAPLYTATFPGLDGQPVSLSQLRGKVAVVNFWATWCPPCRKEMPDLVAAYAKYHDRGVAFVGIAVEDDAERVQEFARAYKVEYPLATGKAEGIALLQALGNSVAGLPYTLVLDTQGNIVDRKRGPISPDRLEGALQEAMVAPAADSK
ncbi:hypothetical protein SKTS_25940 [Sulfurimicrobium lacus]|uniref:Thioredoxin domain-containing protein n=1 Tax=Sulfurimicrobium lacus TaxID=2715678 RepID=A0A6F8VDB1_9PROT|nr:TlpA disulfide reductase family protein [Sulfurimicrobium lacus]BCB27708.1 hypothetical protein SKTS_25940 [Sulfurimicrobium lacus]